MFSVDKFNGTDSKKTVYTMPNNQVLIHSEDILLITDRLSFVFVYKNHLNLSNVDFIIDNSNA